MRTVRIEEAQTKLPKLIHDLLQGEELVITEDDEHLEDFKDYMP